MTVGATDFVFTPLDVSHGLSDNQIRYISQLPDGRLVFTTSGNLNIYNGSGFTYIHRTARHVYPLAGYDGHYRVYRQGDSLLWVKDTHKLMCVNLRREAYVEGIDAYLKHRGAPLPFDDLFMDSAGRLWLLSAGKLWQDGRVVCEPATDKGSLQDLEGDGDNLYLFYATGEVACHDPATGRERYCKAAYGANEQGVFGRTSLVVRAGHDFCQLRNGTKGGFWMFDTRRCLWRKMLETNYALNTVVVRAGSAYISCATGLWIVNIGSGEKRYLPALKTVAGNVIDTEISTVFYDRQGGLWLGTLNRGLLYYHPARYRLSLVGRSFFPVASTKDIMVQAFAQDEAGRMYVKCNQGVYHYHPADNKANVLTPVPEELLPAPVRHALNRRPPTVYEGHEYTALHTDARGRTWAGTGDGLMLFEPGADAPRVFYAEDGLVNNFVHALLEDRRGSLWVTTSHGISQVQADAETSRVNFVNFNTYDGTLSGEYADHAVFEAADGTLFMGGINGFNTIRPEQVRADAVPFRPVFTNLYLQGSEVRVGREYGGRVIMPVAAPYTKTLELLHNQNFLTLEFSAVNYLNPSKTRYRYRLTGIDDQPREAHAEAGGMLRVAYTNLPHGTYTFTITATASGSEWSGEETEISITISAPWWQTTVAYVLYVLCGVCVVALAVWLYVRHTRRTLERRHREEVLLFRIRSLIDQNKLLEEEKMISARKPEVAGTEPAVLKAEALGTADSEFLARAIELVEANLNVPGYSVEMLSRDLCMDRTGLYRRLMALLDKSPSLFIRNIRLQKAAQLIAEGRLSIADIAEQVGFSSSSYMSKCFQEVYGCKPSEYAEKAKKST